MKCSPHVWQPISIASILVFVVVVVVVVAVVVVAPTILNGNCLVETSSSKCGEFFDAVLN